MSLCRSIHGSLTVYVSLSVMSRIPCAESVNCLSLSKPEAGITSLYLQDKHRQTTTKEMTLFASWKRESQELLVIVVGSTLVTCTHIQIQKKGENVFPVSSSRCRRCLVLPRVLDTGIMSPEFQLHPRSQRRETDGRGLRVVKVRALLTILFFPGKGRRQASVRQSERSHPPGDESVYNTSLWFERRLRSPGTTTGGIQTRRSRCLSLCLCCSPPSFCLSA